jgi:hypothetical protein
MVPIMVFVMIVALVIAFVVAVFRPRIVEGFNSES